MPGEPGRVSRRSVLRASGAVAVGGVAAMGTAAAGCANSGSFDPATTGGQFVTLIPLDKVPVGGVASVTIDRRPAFIARPTADAVRAFSAVCTHRGCTVVAADTILLCPCHGSHFELLTGDVLRGPAETPLPPIDVTIAGGNVIRG